MRNLKIIASVVFMIALLLSISIFASADPLSIAIGGAMSAYAEAAGVTISSSGFSANAFDSYWHDQSGLGEDWLDPLSDYRVYYHRNSNNTVNVYTDGAILPLSKTGIENWITTNSITSNSSATLLTSNFSFSGYPFPNVDGAYVFTEPLFTFVLPTVYAQGQTFTFGNSDLVITLVAARASTYPIHNFDTKFYWHGNLTYGSTTSFELGSVYKVFLHSKPANGNVFPKYNLTGVPSGSDLGSSLGSLGSDTSSLSYQSATIDTVVPTGKGLWMTNIPVSAFSGISDVEDGYNSDTDVKSAIISALNDYAAQNGWTTAPYFADSPDIPVPPTPTPYPTDALGTIPYDTWMQDYGSDVTDTLGLIDQDIQDFIDTIGLYGDDIVDVIDTYGQSAVEAIEDQTDVIDTYGSAAVDSLDNIDVGINAPLTGVKAKLDSLIDSIANVGENILEAVKEEILGDIAKIETSFAPVITRLRNAMSIWHYVVEWVGSIGSVFGWMMGFASNTSYYMVLPIYACIAGGIVLGVYRRFGR